MKKIIFILLCLFPIISSLLYIYFFGVNVAFWDQFDVILMFDQYFHNTLTLHDFFVYSNEHLIFFPKIVMLILGVLSSYNNIVEMYFIQLLLLISLLFLYLAFKRQLYLSKKYLWFLPVPYIVFSFREYENILSGFEITFLMAFTFGIVAFYFIYIMGNYKNKFTTIGYFACAIVSAIVSSYSSFMGLFVWLAGLIEIAITPIEKTVKLGLVMIWSLIGSLVWLFYFSHYDMSSIHKINILAIIYNPILFFDFYFTIIGSSLFWHHNIAVISGIFIVVVLIYLIIRLYKNGKIKNNVFWISLVIFSLLTALAITIGRSFLAIEQATCPRYTIFSSLTVIAILMIIRDVSLYEIKLFKNIVQYAINGILLLSILQSYYLGIITGSKIKATRNEKAYILLHYKLQNDNQLKTLYPDAKIVKIYAYILEKYNYNVFHR